MGPNRQKCERPSNDKMYRIYDWYHNYKCSLHRLYENVLFILNYAILDYLIDRLLDTLVNKSIN